MNLSVALDWSSKGGIVWSSTSCGGARAPGMEVTVDGPEGVARVFYYGDRGLVDTTAMQTSSLGLGFITNVEPGDRTLEAKVAITEQRVGVYRVIVQAGRITHVTIAPAPDGS